MAIRSITVYANGATVYENGVAGTATSVGIYSFPVYAPDPSSFTASTDGFGIETKTISFEKNGYVFSEWNTAADGTGTSFQIGDLMANSPGSYQTRAVYAIWKLPPVIYTTDSDELTSIADAIRAKGGTSAALVYPTGFVSAINDIPTGGATGKKVFVLLTNPLNPTQAENPACTIFSATGGTVWDSDEPIGSIATPTGYTFVEVPNSCNNIVLSFHSNYPAQPNYYSTLYGDISFSDAVMGYLNLSVTGDGAIIIDGYEWDDD